MTEPQDTLARLTHAAREVGFECQEPSDRDNLHPARGIVWYLLGLLFLLAIAFVAFDARAGELRGLAMLGALHADRTTWCEVDAPPPAAPAAGIKHSAGLPVPPSAPPAAPTSREQDLESFTPGLGIGWDLTPDVMLAAGAWRTSQKNWAAFAFADWRPLRAGQLSAGLFSGVSGGYCKFSNRLGPIGGITARVDLSRVAVHLLYVPSFGSEKNVATLGLALSVGF